MQDLATAPSTETHNLMAAWDFLHEKMWEQVALEKWFAEKYGKTTAPQHPDEIFGKDSLKTPWDSEEETAEILNMDDLRAVVETIPITHVPKGWDVIDTSVEENVDAPAPEVNPKGWDVIDTSVEDSVEEIVETPVPKVKAKKAKSAPKSKKKKD